MISQIGNKLQLTLVVDELINFPIEGDLFEAFSATPRLLLPYEAQPLVNARAGDSRKARAARAQTSIDYAKENSTWVSHLQSPEWLCVREVLERLNIRSSIHVVSVDSSNPLGPRVLTSPAQAHQYGQQHPAQRESMRRRVKAFAEFAEAVMVQVHRAIPTLASSCDAQTVERVLLENAVRACEEIERSRVRRKNKPTVFPRLAPALTDRLGVLPAQHVLQPPAPVDLPVDLLNLNIIPCMSCNFFQDFCICSQ